MAETPMQRPPPENLTALPALSDWHTLDWAEPELVGVRCAACGSYFFPPGISRCRNPACGDDALSREPLSRHGTLWSYTSNHYPPPPPYLAAEPFVPYWVAAVELAREGMIVLGQVVAGVDESALSVGGRMELALGPLHDGAHGERWVWQWRPAPPA